MEHTKLSHSHWVVNKEQILFAITSIVCLLIFQSSYKTTTANYSNTFKPPTKTNKTTTQLQKIAFPNVKFNSYWDKSLRHPFDRIYDWKALAPAELKLPEIETFSDIIFPTIPAPRKSSWRQFPLKEFTPFSQDITAEKEIILNTKTVNNEVGDLAKKLKANVREQDTILLRNNQKYLGKIIKETSKKVIISVKTGEGSSAREQIYHVPKNKNAKILPAIDLQQVCRNYAKNLSKSNINKWIALSQACGELELDALAREFFEKTLSLYTRNINSYLSYADYCEGQFDYEAAYSVLLRAQKVPIKSPKLLQHIAKIQEKMGLKERALMTLVNNNEKHNLLTKIQLAFSLQKYQQVKEYLQKIPPETEGATPDPNIAYWQARVKLNSGQLDECLKVCEKITGHAPIQNLKGVALYAKGELLDAITALREAANQGEKFAWYNLALVYFSGGAKEQALKLLKKIIDQSVFIENAGQIQAVYGYMKFFYEKENFKQEKPEEKEEKGEEEGNEEENEKEPETPIEILQSALKKNPNNLLPHYYLAELYQQQKTSDFTKSYEHYRKTLVIDFSFVQSLLRLAPLSCQNKNYSDAIQYLKEILKRQATLSPKEISDVYTSLAWVQIAQENIAASKKSLALATETNPTNPMALKLSAMLANREGNYREAITYLDRVLNNNEKDAYANETRSAISENSTSVFWEDAFTRRDNAQIRKGWIEKESNGIDINLKKRKVHFKGTQLRKEVPTILTRKMSEPRKFISFSGEIKGKIADKTRCGILISASNRGNNIYFGKTPGNVVGIGQKDRSGFINWKPIEYQNQPYPWPQSGKVKLTIRLKKQAGVIEFLVNKTIILSLNARITGIFSTGFFGYANPAEECEIQYDNARITKRK